MKLGVQRLLHLQTFAALGNRNFRYLWMGQLFHAGSLWMEMIARPILVLQLTDNVVHLGMVLAVRTIPQLILGPLAGVLADRYSRRGLLIFSKCGAAITNFSLALVILSEPLGLPIPHVVLWHVYATSVMKSVFMAFDQPARQSLIPTLVPPHQLLNAVALNSSTMATMRIGGAAIAGLLIATIGIGFTFLTSSVIFVGAVVVTLLIRIPSGSQVQRSGRSIGSDMLQGVKYAWQTPAIRSLLLLAMTYFIVGMSWMQVFAPLFATRVLGIGEAGYGFLISVAGIGSLIGGLTVASLGQIRQRGRLLPILMGTFGLLLVLFSLSTNLPWLIVPFVLVGLVGMLQTSMMSLTNGTLLELSPDELRGRMFGLLSLDRAATTGGGVFAALLAGLVGTQIAQIIFGAIIIVAAIAWRTWSNSLRQID